MSTLRPRLHEHSLSPSLSLVRRWGLALVMGLLLAGCAGHMAYRDGQALIEAGKIEEGLDKLHQAVDAEPHNVQYRQAYLQVRDRAQLGFLERADRLLATDHAADAKVLYQRVLALAPDNERALAGLATIDAVRRHAKLLSEAQTAWNKNDAELARMKLRAILAEDPHDAGALSLRRTIDEQLALPRPEMALSAIYRKPITIEFKDVPLKQVFEVISRTSGLNFLFDKDVKTDQKTSTFLKNSTVAAAVHFVLLTNQLEQQVLDGNTILIYPNTAAKAKDYQEMVVKTFYLANAEAKTVANTLKTIVKTHDIVVDDKLNMVIVRDSPDAVRLAEKLVALQDVAEPEVMLELEVLEVQRTRLLDLGIQWPDSLTLTPLPSTAGGTLTLRDLRTNLNGGTIGASISPVVINAKKADTDANILANPRIRARNHEKAKILIGDRVPNITTTSTATGFVSESVNYVDVGLKLDVEPTVYLDGEVAIKVALEVSHIVSQLQTKSGSLAYQIGTRNASTVLRLKDGENQVLAGLISDEDRRNANKVPGLGELPIAGRLFGSANNNNQKTEIVLSITPHIIRNLTRPQATLSEFAAGTENSFRLRPDALRASPSAPPVGAPASQPVQHAATPNAHGPSPVPAATPATGGIGNPNTDPISTSGGISNSTQTTTPAATLQWQGPSQVKVGDTVALQLLMTPDQPVTGLPLIVGFNNKNLQVVGVSEGDFLKQGGAQSNFASRVDPNGQVAISDTRIGDSGAAAPGVVATVNFRAIAGADASPIQVLTVAPSGLNGRAVVVQPPAPYILHIQP